MATSSTGDPAQPLAGAPGRRAVSAGAVAQPSLQPAAPPHGAALLVAVPVPEAQGQERRVLHHRLRGSAGRRGAPARPDGVVCGHIHKAELRDVGGILYCNDGDWVESLSALAKPTTASCSCWTGPPSRPSIRPGARPIRPAASRARYRCRRCRRRCAARANTRDNPYTSPLRNGDVAVHAPLGHACSWATGERPVHAATCST